MKCAEVKLVAHHSGLGRIAAGEQRSSRWIAEWVLSVSAIKPNAPSGQLIQVRRLDDAIAIATEGGPQVVGRDHNHVIPRLGSCLGVIRRRKQANECQYYQEEYGKPDKRILNHRLVSAISRIGPNRPDVTG